MSYPDREERALDGVSLDVSAGSCLALIGPNGSGKSTLCKSVAGLLRPRSGVIRIFGLPVGGCHHRTAYLPQRTEIEWPFPVDVRRFVLAGRYVHRGWLRRVTDADRAFVSGALSDLGLTSIADRPIGDLSGGQQQRVMLARALVQQAELLLLDEPLNAVDAETRDVILRVLSRLRREGRSVVIVTHDPDWGEDLFDAVVCLQAGRQVDVNACGHGHAGHHGGHRHH